MSKPSIASDQSSSSHSVKSLEKNMIESSTSIVTDEQFKKELSKISPEQEQLLNPLMSIGKAHPSRPVEISSTMFGDRYVKSASELAGDVMKNKNTISKLYGAGVIYHPDCTTFEQEILSLEDGPAILSLLKNRVQFPASGEISIPFLVFFSCVKDASSHPKMSHSLRSFEQLASTMNTSANSLLQALKVQQEVMPALKRLAQFSQDEETSWRRQRIMLDFLRPIIFVGRKNLSNAAFAALKMMDATKLGGAFANLPKDQHYELIKKTLHPLIEKVRTIIPNIDNAIPDNLPHNPF